VDILADTNILLHRIRCHDTRYRQTRDAINRLRSEGHRLCVTSQNLVEFWVVCTRPRASNGFGLPSVVRLPDLDDAYLAWRKLVALHSVSGKTAHDARLVAAMQAHGIARVLTFDVKDFERYPNTQAIHPSQVTAPSD
jgi:predicted nucleic acid-binding protein